MTTGPIEGFFPGVMIYFPTNIRWGDEKLIIEDKVDIGPFVSITAREKVIIGQGTLVSPGACISDTDHLINNDIDQINGKGTGKAITIGKYCWIGANAVILKGVTLGDGCIVGAGAVVTHSFPAKSIIVGNPAKLLRTR